MSLLSRTTLRTASRIAPSVGKTQARNVHFENVVGKTIPTDVTNRPFLAIKIAAFFCAGFGTPFAIAAWHL
ncbi:hypothetical protein FFLO_04032 [Filobasidium floriforme]|uniref:Cytochrome c oxidase subunit 8, mitochondrial n=2 Tax=Filobasidium floriforme TaxID=5210 RepID=A0A8K0NQ87_9TREE|nr:hypothetical protein FFLO_04032 [Filobasidium floriforme]